MSAMSFSFPRYHRFLCMLRWAVYTIIAVDQLLFLISWSTWAAALVGQTREFEARILRGCQFHIKHLREIIAFSVNQEEQSPRSLQWTSGALAIGVKLARLLSRDDQGSLMPGFRANVRYVLKFPKKSSLSLRVKMDSSHDHSGDPPKAYPRGYKCTHLGTFDDEALQRESVLKIPEFS